MLLVSLFACTAAAPPMVYMSGDALYASAFAYVFNDGHGLLHELWSYLFGSPSTTDPVQPPMTSLPDAPHGARLVQFTPCDCTSASVPMFVNRFWNGSKSISSAYISQHGAGSDFDNYFTHLYGYVGEDALLVAPGFYQSNSAQAPRSWYQPDINLAWSAGIDQWPVGRDAVLPASLLHSNDGTGCSSFDTYDALLTRLANKHLYPRLTHVYFVGHSGGANMVSRYSQLNRHNHKLSIRYVVMNAANQAYVDRARPWLDTDQCPKAFTYPYQLTNADGRMPRYVAEHFDALGGSHGSNDMDKASALLVKWSARHVVYLIGDRDTDRTGTQSCASISQGGAARRDRNYAFWAYQNLLARTGADVREYFGYANLTSTGAGQGASKLRFKHQACVVDGVGHDAPGILQSDCGQAALFGNRLPKGAGPRYPERESDHINLQ